MNQKCSNKMSSPLSLLQHPASFQKTLQGLVYAVLSGAFTTHVFRRLTWTQKIVLYLISDMREHLTVQCKRVFRATRLNGDDFDELVSWNDHEDCDIFITMPVRKLGNPHCYFSDYLHDLTTSTKNLNRIITYATIDEDDDLKYFLNLKRNLGSAVRLRYFVKPKNAGYYGGHAMHSMMIDNGPTRYKVWVLGASDAKPVFSGWDKRLMKAISSAKDACLIGGGPRWSAGAIHGPNPDGFPPI